MNSTKIVTLTLALVAAFCAPQFAFSAGAEQVQEQGRLKVVGLMQQTSIRTKIQGIDALSDADYEKLKQIVLQALIEDKLAGKSDFNLENIGLGYNAGQKFMLIESKPGSKNRILLMVYDNKVKVDTLQGGPTLVAAFNNYVKNFNPQDQLQRLLNQSGAALNLPYLIATLKRSLPEVAVDMDGYEALHDIREVLSVKIEQGPRAGQDLIELKFVKKDGTPNRYPQDGISIDNFGQIRFYPYVELGKVSGAGKTGACVRICESAKDISCVDKVERSACESQEVFGGTLRCPVTINWDQNLNCAIAQKLK